ncbi:MAG: Flp pilus assembly protein CpaB [Planctomycetes bacterium]|nr:Flp pilus assembly protein CpaB [Planctomycetota bacterium]
MQPRTLIIGVLALVFGLCAAAGVYVMSQTAASPRKPETTTVYITATDISRGQVITGDLLSKKEWPKDAVPTGAVTALDQVENRTVAIPMVAGDLVLETKLAPQGAGRGVAVSIPLGMRAVTIQTPNISTGVAGFVLPGNKVDILLTVTQSGADDPSGGGSTYTLLQNIEILAVDQRIEVPLDNKVDMKEMRSVTLLVTPGDAAKLGLGQNRGLLHLALRNPEDREMDDIDPVTLAGLRISAPQPIVVPQTPPQVVAIPKPEKPPAVQIRLLRGTTSSVIPWRTPETGTESLPTVAPTTITPQTPATTGGTVPTAELAGKE